MGKQKATFDQLFPRYTYTVYDYKLLQRSKRYLPSWHWILVSIKSLYIRKATASVGPKKHFWFTLEKTTQCSLCVSNPGARVCGVFSITSCHRQYNLAQTPVLSAAPPRSSITTGAMKEEKMHVGYWKAVSTRGAGISDSTALCRAAQTAWYLSESINYQDRKSVLTHSLCFIVCKVRCCPPELPAVLFSWKKSVLDLFPNNQRRNEAESLSSSQLPQSRDW